MGMKVINLKFVDDAYDDSMDSYIVVDNEKNRKIIADMEEETDKYWDDDVYRNMVNESYGSLSELLAEMLHKLEFVSHEVIEIEV